jgi:hypothetical protein
MLVRRSRTLDLLSISALDLFASALGVFVLMAVLLFPFYLKQPSIEAELQGAEAQMAAAGMALTEARRVASEEAEALGATEALHARAIDEVQQAEASKAEAEQALAEAAARSQEVGELTASLNEELASIAIADLDLVFVMDTTGSMRREIADVQANLMGIVRVLHRLAPSLNVGFVAFRDRGEQYVTRAFPLSPMAGNNLSRIQEFVRSLNAQGGDDYPESVGVALDEAMAMAWRGDAQGRIIVIGDAPDRAGEMPRIFEIARRFQSSATSDELPRAVSAIFTHSPYPEGRRFYQDLAAAGGGDFVDHQGRMMESVLLSVLDPAAGR